MAEPKGNDIAELTSRKSTKKSSKKNTSNPTPNPIAVVDTNAPHSTTPSTKSPVPMLQSMPTTAYPAEPKAVENVNVDALKPSSKSKSSKKSTPGAEPSVITNTAQHSHTIINAVTETPLIRKEAKKAKKQDMLIARVLEEEKQRELQRQREARQQQELTALNANAEECQEEDGDPYEEDAFESYGDDGFEEYSDSQSSIVSLSNTAPDQILPSADMKRVQQAMQAQAKSPENIINSVQEKKQSKKIATSSQPREITERSSSALNSLACLKQALDPRAKRLQSIHKHVQLEIEKAFIFQMKPLNVQELYLHKIRRNLARQIGNQSHDGMKNASTQTKVVKESQSTNYPDEIDFTALLSKHKKQKRHDIGDESKESGEDTLKSGICNNDEIETQTAGNSMKFFQFLSQASYICEVLAESNVIESIGDQSMKEAMSNNTSGRSALLISNTSAISDRLVYPLNFEDLQCNDSSTKQLLRAQVLHRELVHLVFSPLLSNILLTSYGADIRTNQINDCKRVNSLGCVWDLNQSSMAGDSVPHNSQIECGLVNIISGEGEATINVFAPFEELIVIGGTMEGCIHVWDLRQTVLQSKKYSVQREVNALQTTSPCYSTNTLSACHTSSVVGIEFLRKDNSNNYLFIGDGSTQFATMDDRGILHIWSLIELPQDDSALLSDVCVYIGSTLKLVLTLRMDTQEHFLNDQSYLNTYFLAIGPIVATFKIIPGDRSQRFIIGTSQGKLVQASRFEQDELNKEIEKNPRKKLTKNKTKGFQYYRVRKSKTASYPQAAVVCIDFHPIEHRYFLVGYDDGTVCLFQKNHSVCICTWDEVDAGVSVCSLQWSQSRSGVFYVSYANGKLLIWDLLVQTQAPALSYSLPSFESIPTSNSFRTYRYPFALSSTVLQKSRPVIAFRHEKKRHIPYQLSVHELRPEFTASNSMEQDEIRDIFTSIL